MMMAVMVVNQKQTETALHTIYGHIGILLIKYRHISKFSLIYLIVRFTDQYVQPNSNPKTKIAGKFRRMRLILKNYTHGEDKKRV